MRKNVGRIDRIIRTVAAIALVILLLTGKITGGAVYLFGFAALILLFTGTTSFCPCYVRMNINTNQNREKTEE